MGDRKGIPYGNRPLGRPRHSWKIILKYIFKKAWGGTVWIDLAQDGERWLALVNVVMNLQVP
jgi:hypothetical protein